MQLIIISINNNISDIYNYYTKNDEKNEYIEELIIKYENNNRLTNIDLKELKKIENDLQSNEFMIVLFYI